MILKEIWKDVNGYEGYYKVSNFGRLKCLERIRSNGRKYPEKIIIPRISNGYLRVGLTKPETKRKFFNVHRLVLEAFNPVPNMKKLIVNHKDENRCNNHVDNLEWCTYSYNNTYGTRLEKSARALGKEVICIETGITYYSIAEAERKTGVYHQSISVACNNKMNTAGGFHWKFLSSKEDLLCNQKD